MPYYQDASVTIYCQDVRAGIPLPDGSVQCVVTSPPYWGLRDYGTATWEGGEAGCDHRQPANWTRNKGRDRAASGGTLGRSNGEAAAGADERADQRTRLERSHAGREGKNLRIPRGEAPRMKAAGGPASDKVEAEITVPILIFGLLYWAVLLTLYVWGA